MINRSNQRSGSGRRWLFRLILLTPLLGLLVVAGSCLARGLKVQGADLTSLTEQVEEHLKVKPGEPYKVQSRGSVAGVVYQENGPFKPFNFQQGDKVIYAFGGSTLVYPVEGSFPERLEELARADGEPWRVFNFGNTGFDSFSVRNRLEVAVPYRAPDLVIIYSGHNDFTSTYWNLVLPHLFLVQGNPVMEVISRAVYAVSDALRDKSKDIEPFLYDVYLRTSLEPAMFNLATGTLGLFSSHRELFKQVNQLILQHYKRNMAAMLALCRAKGVPVVLVTPVSNLHYPPVGVDGQAQALFAKGLAAASYEQRIKLLVKAKDADIFSGMVRAKSALLDYLRGLNDPPRISVLQLDIELYAAKHPLDGTQFFDALHFKEPFHQVVAQHLVKHIKENGLLKK